MSASYGYGRLLPGDPGYHDSQYAVDQAAELERERWMLERERHDGPFTPTKDPEVCEYCGRKNLLQPDPLEWDCCIARRVWAEARYEAVRLRSSLERAVARLDEVTELEEWSKAPWGVRYDVSGVRLDLYTALARAS